MLPSNDHSTGCDVIPWPVPFRHRCQPVLGSLLGSAAGIPRLSHRRTTRWRRRWRTCARARAMWRRNGCSTLGGSSPLNTPGLKLFSHIWKSAWYDHVVGTLGSKRLRWGMQKPRCEPSHRVRASTRRTRHGWSIARCTLQLCTSGSHQCEATSYEYCFVLLRVHALAQHAVSNQQHDVAQVRTRRR